MTPDFVFGGAGLMFAWVMTRVPAELWPTSTASRCCALGLLLLLLVLIPGIGATVNGARRCAADGPDQLPGVRSSPRCWC